MATTDEHGSRPPIAARPDVVRFLSACQRLWHADFPGLHRRAQPQIVHHLGTRGRGGATVGELHGLVKQIFLLDDSTVKERIQDISRQGLCRLDPAEEPLSTRSVVIPTDALLARFDRHVRALGEQLLAAAAALDPSLRAAVLVAVDAPQRTLILRAPETYAEARHAALERIFDAQARSRARRVEAVRHLNAISHGTLLHMAVEHHHGVSPLADGDSGLLADRMAAALLGLTGQNFQTTRDHIGYLLEAGLLARQPGKALRVALAEAAAPQLDAALDAVAGVLPALARGLAGAVPVEPEALRTARRRVDGPRLRHALLVATPEAAPRRVALDGPAITIGRLPPCDLLLPGADVSRQHCRLELAGQELRITDLHSTNGTLVDGRRLVGTETLRPGATVQVGSCRLTYECGVVAEEADADRDEGTLRRPIHWNKAGNLPG